jgi:hypothetical protein
MGKLEKYAPGRSGFHRLRKNSKRREAGVSTPHKASKINAGFSPGGMLSTNFTRNIEFFRSLFNPGK